MEYIEENNHGPVSTNRNSGGGMAHFYRLVFVCFFFFAGSAQAQIAPTVTTGCPVTAASTTALNSCKSGWAGPNCIWGVFPGSPNTCAVTSPANPTYNDAIVAASTITTCPANSTLTGSSCICNANYLQTGNTCVSIEAQNKAACDANAQGLTFTEATLIHYGSVGLTACFGGFVVEGTGSAGGGGQTELYGPFKCSGQSASACTTVAKPTSISTTCAPGEFPGTVNGVQVCVPPSSIVDAPKRTTATPPTSGASAPVIPNTPAGTTSTTEQTTCTGTQCTTTTSFNNSSGASLGTQVESKPVTSFCAENPTFSACKEAEKNKWGGGSCDAPPSCSGDAVMCAVALESFKTSCALAPPANDESALYDTEKLKDGTVIVDDLPGSKTVGINSGMFSTTNVLGGGSGGMADLNVTVADHAVTLPFTTVNTVLQWLGYILLAVGFLLSSRIVVRG